MESPKISILIANYNNGHFFKDCFNSLIIQTENNWEAIVIDDCSTDNSVEIIKEQIKDDFRFKFFENEINLGYQKTILKAISLVNSSIFGRLDPDDALFENAIELSLKAHSENPNIGLVYSNFTFCDENLKERNIHQAKQILNFDENYYNFKGEISHFASFKINFYNKTSGIDSNNKRAEDKDIYMKMCEVAPVLHINETLYKYRIHQTSASNNSNSDKALFWHWVALIKMAERRQINLEDLFFENFAYKKKYKNIDEIMKKSKIFKWLYKLRLFRFF